MFRSLGKGETERTLRDGAPPACWRLWETGIRSREALFQATGGLPRKINLLAHHALHAAALARVRTVSADHVEAALPEVA